MCPGLLAERGIASVLVTSGNKRLNLRICQPDITSFSGHHVHLDKILGEVVATNTLLTVLTDHPLSPPENSSLHLSLESVGGSTCSKFILPQQSLFPLILLSQTP